MEDVGKPPVVRSDGVGDTSVPLELFGDLDRSSQPAEEPGLKGGTRIWIPEEESRNNPWVSQSVGRLLGRGRRPGRGKGGVAGTQKRRIG